MNEKLEKYRVLSGEWGTNVGDDHGLFFIPLLPGKPKMKVLCAHMNSPIEGWQHVSVSLPNRCPTWKEMDYIKRLFWGDDVAVAQFHVPRKKHINIAKNCLHLWRNVNNEFTLPPTYMV